MLVTKICKICGVEFDATAPHQLYCSTTCKRVHHKEYAQMWRDRNREEYRKYQREYQRKYSHIGNKERAIPEI